MEAASIEPEASAGARAEPSLWFRAVLVPLAAVQAINGAWALAAPRSFYGDFPFGRGWVEALPAYNEHLMRDVGGLFLMSAVLLAAAAWWLDRRLVAVALVAWLTFAVPHAGYHALNLGPYATGDAIANVLTLGATVVLPVLLLALLAGAGGRRKQGSRQDDGEKRRPPPAARGPRIEPRSQRSRNPLVRLAYRSSRKRYGQVMDPIGVFAHHPRLLTGYAALELATERSSHVPGRIKHLAAMRAGMLCGCEWCLDFGSALSAQHGVSEEDLRELATYATSDRFEPTEKLVLDLASAVSRTPVEVPDELFDRLRERFDEAQLVELVSEIALENYRARFNWAFGLASQGFAEGSFCVRPASADEAPSPR